MSQLMLDGKVVLRRILAPHMRLELSKQENWTEYRPVHRLSPHRIKYSIEWIRIHSTSILTKKRQVELSVHGESTAAEWRLCAELLQYELLNRVIEESPASTNAGLSRRSRTPRNTDARSKGFVVSLSKSSRNSLISRN